MLHRKALPSNKTSLVCSSHVHCHTAGTPDYMSPELLGAKASHCPQALYDGTKADIWAAGVMLCVMLIGRFPFEGIEMSNATNLEEVSEHVSGPWWLGRVWGMRAG